MLEVTGVVKQYGGVRAVDGVSFSASEGEILGLIGPNGSGKTTLLSLIAGTQAATEGTVDVGGKRVSGTKAHRAVRAGVARTFQTTRLLPTWTLRETSALAHSEGGHGSAGIEIERIADLLGLGADLERPCASLTSAHQRLAMIAVALATAPRVLLLDEPAVGMDTDEAQHLANAVQTVRNEFGVTVIVVDHNMHFLMPLADRVLVMAAGKLLAEGTPAEIRADEAVIASYLGS